MRGRDRALPGVAVLLLPLLPVVFAAGCSGGDGGQDSEPTSPSNQPPVAELTHSPSEPEVGETVTLDASGSSDPDGSIQEYRWDFDGDGTDDQTTTAATTEHSYSEEGDHEPAVTVEDDDGDTDRASTTVAVRVGDDPVIDAVSPDVLEEGTTATIEGHNFGSTASENEVLVDGVEASVTSATETELEVTVPQYDCRPTRTGDVQVTVGGAASDQVETTVRPDEAPVDLDPGERMVIREPADDFCLQFQESSSSQEYLVGVQSVTDALGITTVDLTAETGSSGSGSVVGGAAAEAGPGGSALANESGGRGRAGGISPAASRASRRWAEHYRAESRLRAWEREHLYPVEHHSLPRRGGPPTARSHGSSVPGSVSEGDVVTLRVPDLANYTDGDQLCENYIEIDAEVMEVGEHGIWVADVDNPDSGFSSSDWDDLSDKFDDLVYPTDTDYFGEPTDLDSNDRVVMAVTKEVNEFSGVFGFVWGGDLFPRQSDSGFSCESSDEGELTYLSAPDPSGEHGDDLSVEVMKRAFPQLVAHEFTHMIQKGVRFSCEGCSPMPPFISEGQATVAEEVVGHAETGRSPGNDYGASVAFLESPRNWYQNRFDDLARYYGWADEEGVQHEEAPEECSWLARDWAGVCDGDRGVYGVPSLIMRWIADHFGQDYPGGEEGLFRDMTASTETGFDNLESLTGLSMKEILGYWAPMLWTDGRVSVRDEMLTLPSWDLKDIQDGQIEEAQLRPFERTFTDFSDSFGVNAGSAAYYLVSGDSRSPTAIRARAPDGGPLASYMQMWLVRTK